MKILHAITGSVAAEQAGNVERELLLKIPNANITSIATGRAGYFLEKGTLMGMSLTDEDEWTWKKRGDSILHIDLCKDNDVLVIAPLSANTLAKISHGLCDNLVTCVVRAWNYDKPLILAPAMNTKMWENPLTRPQLDIMTSMGASIISPIEKLLMCGDRGMGAMANAKDIADFVSVRDDKI